MNILLPVDGSDNALRAVRFVIGLAKKSAAPPEIHLLAVQPPIISGDVKMFIAKEDIDGYYRDEGNKALAAARAELDAAAVKYQHHIGVGHIAETIAAYVKEKGCTQVVMGTRGMGGFAGMVLGSVATKVVHLVSCPVTLVK